MIYFDLPYGDYRARPQLGSTDLKNILKSPAHFLEAKHNPTSSKAKSVGSAVHAYMLERSTFFSLHAVEPEGLVHKGRNPWKKDWDKFKEDNADKTIVDRDTWMMIKGIQRSIVDHPWASKIFEQSAMEVSVIGDLLKGRADLLTPNFVVDLKTCEDATSDIIWDIQKYQYYLQAALYLDLFQNVDGKERKFLWIACEKVPPYCVKVYVASDEMIEMGRREYTAAREIYKRCSERNEWPGYDSDIEELAFTKFFKGALG